MRAGENIDVVLGGGGGGLTFWLTRFSGLGEVSRRTGLYSFFTREGPEGFQTDGVLFTSGEVGDRGDLAFCSSKKDRGSGSGC